MSDIIKEMKKQMIPTKAPKSESEYSNNRNRNRKLHYSNSGPHIRIIGIYKDEPFSDCKRPGDRGTLKETTKKSSIG